MSKFNLSKRLVRRGFFGDEDIGALVLFVGGEDLLFEVAALGVDFPKVEFRAGLKSKNGTAGLPNAKSGELTHFSWRVSWFRQGPAAARRRETDIGAGCGCFPERRGF